MFGIGTDRREHTAINLVQSIWNSIDVVFNGRRVGSGIGFAVSPNIIKAIIHLDASGL